MNRLTSSVKDETVTLPLLRSALFVLLALGALTIVYIVAPILIPLLLVIGGLAIITILMRILARRIERLKSQR